MDTVGKASSQGYNKVSAANSYGLSLSSMSYEIGITENTRYRAFTTSGSYVFRHELKSLFKLIA